MSPNWETIDIRDVEDIYCQSPKHSDNSEEKSKKILEGRILHVAVKDDEVDSVCCSKCDIRECYSNNLSDIDFVLTGIIKENVIEIKQEWNLQKPQDGDYV